MVRAAAALAVASTLALIAFLPFAGRYLVVEDPLERADAIFVLAGARVERWLEAAELYREGWAPRIILSPGRQEDAEIQLRARGIRFPAEAGLIRDALIQMQVPADAIVILPESVDNTAQEATAVRTLSAGTDWQRIIVVTSKYHGRRSAYAFRREFRGSPVRVLMRASRFDTASPERWWTRRSDFRFVTWELQKLVAYWLGARG